MNAATNNRSNKGTIENTIDNFQFQNNRRIVPFFFSSVHRSIILILHSVKIRTEFQSRSCLFINLLSICTFFMKTVMDFPFRLVLSISHLDHFRGISSRPSSRSISPLLVNEKVVDHFFEIKKRRGGGEGGKRERKKKRSGESISGSGKRGLKTRSLVLSRNRPFRYYQRQFFEPAGAQFDASVSAGKNPEDPSSLPVFQIRCPVSRSWRKKGKKKRSGTIDLPLNWISYSLINAVD